MYYAFGNPIVKFTKKQNMMTKLGIYSENFNAYGTISE